MGEVLLIISVCGSQKPTDTCGSAALVKKYAIEEGISVWSMKLCLPITQFLIAISYHISRKN